MPAALPYRLLIRAVVPLVPRALRDPAARRAHAGRLGAPVALAHWAAGGRDPERPLAGIQSATGGEGLQARAVQAALAARRSDVQRIATRFSASAERLAETLQADFVGYLPYDRAADVRQALDAVRPDVLAFAKLDVWPELATTAAARGTRVALVAGSVDPGSARLGGLARRLAQRGYRALDRVGAIDGGDAERLTLLGVRPEAITVTGDPRVDSVLEAIDRDGMAGGDDDAMARTLVAGSTWPDDEGVLLEAFREVRIRFPDARLVIAPHVPDSGHLYRLEAAMRRLGLSAQRWHEGAVEAPVAIVDRLGVLPRLYPGGLAAYVGGGFGRRGVHSVLEPAGWARPVVIGPNDRGVRDARLLETAGALVRLDRRSPVAALAARWSAWLEDPGDALARGRSARAALEPDRGAALRCAELLEELLPSGANQPPNA